MKKRTIIIILISILVLTIITILSIKNSQVIKTSSISNNEYIKINDKILEIKKDTDNIGLEQINDILDRALDQEIILKINNQYIAKCDIIKMEKLINSMDEEQKSNKDNAINETIKQSIVIEEAINNAISISDYQLETFKSVAEKMYETSDKTLTKDEYIQKWLRIQQNEEYAFLYKAKIQMEIAEGTFKPLDENTKQKLDLLNKTKNVSNLDAVYDSHILYLSQGYLLN